jgi:tripartite-type tricarboxylate transporter receptor subunit TctC
VVDNRPGAGGMIGLDAVAKAAPDGHVFGLCAAGPPVINPALGVPQPFDPEKDLTPIMQTGEQPNVLIAHPKVPGEITEFVAWLRANPGEPFGTPGAGSTNHITGIAFALALGTTVTHAGYRGTGPAKADLVASHIRLVIDNIAGDILSLTAAGKVRPVVVSTAKRSHLLPDVPTMVESGLPGLSTLTYYGFLGPAATPVDVVTRINAEVNECLKSAELRASMVKVGFEPTGGSPQDFAVLIAEQLRHWAPIVKSTGFQME